MSLITSRSRPRSALMEAGTSDAGVIAQRVNEVVGLREADGHFEELAGHARISSSSSTAAGCAEKCPSASVARLSPARI